MGSDVADQENVVTNGVGGADGGRGGGVVVGGGGSAGGANDGRGGAVVAGALYVDGRGGAVATGALGAYDVVDDGGRGNVAADCGDSAPPRSAPRAL